jgi:mycoredoxin
MHRGGRTSLLIVKRVKDRSGICHDGSFPCPAGGTPSPDTLVEAEALMSNSPLTMYTTTWCGYCVRLKQQLDRAGVAYLEVDIEQDPAAAATVASVNGGNRTVPTLVFPDGSAATNPSAKAVIERLASIAGQQPRQA